MAKRARSQTGKREGGKGHSDLRALSSKADRSTPRRQSVASPKVAKKGLLVELTLEQSTECTSASSHEIKDAIELLKSPSIEFLVPSKSPGVVSVDGRAEKIKCVRLGRTAQLSRRLVVVVRFDSAKKALAALVDVSVCDGHGSDFDALLFARTLLGDYEGVWVGDNMCDFETKLVSEHVAQV